MTYVVTEPCIRCKYTDCVEVCSVDCFYEGENMLVIHPDECIDCGVCEPECPVDAIKPDTEPALDFGSNSIASTPSSGQTSQGRSLHSLMQTPLWACLTSSPNTLAPIQVRVTSLTLYRGNLEIVEAFHYQAAILAMDRTYPFPDWLAAKARMVETSLELDTNSGPVAVKPGQWIVRDRRGNFQILEAKEFHKIYRAMTG